MRGKTINTMVRHDPPPEPVKVMRVYISRVTLQIGTGSVELQYDPMQNQIRVTPNNGRFVHRSCGCWFAFDGEAEARIRVAVDEWCRGTPFITPGERRAALRRIGYSLGLFAESAGKELAL